MYIGTINGIEYYITPPKTKEEIDEETKRIEKENKELERELREREKRKEKEKKEREERKKNFYNSLSEDKKNFYCMEPDQGTFFIYISDLTEEYKKEIEEIADDKLEDTEEEYYKYFLDTHLFDEVEEFLKSKSYYELDLWNI